MRAVKHERDTRSISEILREHYEAHKRDMMNRPWQWPTPEWLVFAWVAHGLDCAVARGPLSLCGYVRVPPGHPIDGRYWDDEAVAAAGIDVHGGLTFMCRALHGGSWFGFDCGHFDDAIVTDDLLVGGRIWTVPEVVHETERLAEQLANMRKE